MNVKPRYYSIAAWLEELDHQIRQAANTALSKRGPAAAEAELHRLRLQNIHTFVSENRAEIKRLTGEAG